MPWVLGTHYLPSSHWNGRARGYALLAYVNGVDPRMIIQAVQKAQRQNASLALCALPADARYVFQTSELDQLIKIRQSREEALAVGD